jgi:hypothetical protein
MMKEIRWRQRTVEVLKDEDRHVSGDQKDIDDC